MFVKYLLTGATGFLGRTVCEKLIDGGAEVTALVIKNDPLAGELPEGVNIVCGDVCDDASLERFFCGADSETCVIHCAGIVSVASKPGASLYRVNVGGTNNIIRCCERSSVGKLVFVSSVHAIPEKPKGTKMTEDAEFFPDKVQGGYAKSKAIATSLVFDAAKRGLNASVVFPSGIIGPGDRSKGSITNMLLSFIKGKLPFAVKGGYDFVDVRDVAAGIIACANKGVRGQGYILSGYYASVRSILDAAQTALGVKRRVIYLPILLAKLAAPFCERRSLRKHRPLYLTPYSIAVLDSNAEFSRRKAETVFGYAPRSVEASINDAVVWLKKTAGFAGVSRRI